MKRSVLVILATAVLGGCAVLSGPVDRAADATAKGVTAYCENFTPDQRQMFGDKVRARAAPADIRVTCP